MPPLQQEGGLTVRLQYSLMSRCTRRVAAWCQGQKVTEEAEQFVLRAAVSLSTEASSQAPTVYLSF